MEVSSFAMWSAYRQKPLHAVIGIMSGTSLDGVDAALVNIDTNKQGEITNVELVEFEYIPYSAELKNKLSSLCTVEHAKLDELLVAHYGISEWYAYAVEKLLAQADIQRTDVDMICMHGQTVWHAPVPVPFPAPFLASSPATIPSTSLLNLTNQTLVKSTLQIGEPAVVRERTGIPVISNLRARDVAAGGDGAPLTPYVDAILFRSDTVGRIVQNIGGIGNATIIPAGASSENIYAYDTGPGKMVMDAIVREETAGRMQFDENGSIAAKGVVNLNVVELYFDEDPYYTRKPPKSTGREVYGASYASAFREEARRLGMSFEDTVASATALTAMSIVRSYDSFVFPKYHIGEVIVAGGGAHNETLLSMIRQRLPAHCKLLTSEQFGIPDDAREAIAFAVLGHESLMGRTANLPSVTGATRPVILGTITL